MSSYEIDETVKRVSEHLEKIGGPKDAAAFDAELMHLMRQIGLALLDERNAPVFRQFATSVLTSLSVPGVYGPANRFKVQVGDASRDLGWTIGGAVIGGIIGGLLAGPPGAEAGALLGAIIGAGYSSSNPPPPPPQNPDQ